MPIYKPTELHRFLEELGVHPKKGLSQNFLIDGNILRKIAATADLQEGDVVLEVGPGPGSLTEELLAKKAHVIAVEKDEVFAKALSRLNAEDRNLTVFCEDILDFSIESIVGQHLGPSKKAKVIANLPYHLTTPIIAKFVEMRHLFSTLTLMVQEEVAKRFVAKPKTAEYSSFTVFLNFFTNPKYAFTVSRQCFYPAPSVDSAIVVLELKEPPAVSNREDFFKLTRTAFQHRRKMLRSSLRELYPSKRIEECLIEMGKNPTARPEELSLEEFLRLFEMIRQSE